MREQAELVQCAETLREMYDEFTQSVQDLGNKAKGRSTAGNKMGNSFLHWIGGSHIRTDRDRLCEEFLEKVQAQLELIRTALEGAGAEETAEVWNAVADVMLEPIPGRSNATTDLMKRAMCSQFQPMLAFLTPEQLRGHYDRLKAAYRPRDLLPVEKELLREMERRLSLWHKDFPDFCAAFAILRFCPCILCVSC